MKLLSMSIVVGMMLMGCRGSTEHKVSGKAEVRHVVSIEFGTCDKLPRPDQVECVKALLALLVQLNEMEKEGGSTP
jgi:hypothetical protein